MSTKNDLKQLSDSNNKTNLELKNKVDLILSDIYKKMYKSASKGEYSINVIVHKDEWMFYRKAFDVLESEKFEITSLKAYTPKNKIGEILISWEK